MWKVTFEMLFGACVCFEVPGRKKKNRKGSETRSSVSPAGAGVAAASGVTPSSSLVSGDKLTTLSSVDIRCSESSSDITPSSSDSTLVGDETVIVEVADGRMSTASAAFDKNNNATGEISYCPALAEQWQFHSAPCPGTVT